MPRLWPILAILAAAIVLVVFVFAGDPANDDSLDTSEDYIGDDEKNPELMAAEAVRRKKAADAEAARRAAEAKKNAPPPTPTTVLFLKGVVLDDATGQPIAGASVWAEHAQDPCPRAPQIDAVTVGRGVVILPRKVAELAPSSVATAKDGRFDWRVSAIPKKGYYDVFADARGYVTGCLCLPARGSEVTVRLKPALKLNVRVTDRHGRPVEGATVRVAPGADAESDLGHVGIALTDEHGRCEIDGLLPGDIVVTGDHPEYMPATAGPLDPAQKKEVELKLPPAMRFSFTLRSDDGSPIKNPTLRWQTDGKPPHEDLLLLPFATSGPPAQPHAEIKTTKPVRIPCDHRNVQLELKADGFEAWRPPAEPLPAEGGEKEVIAVLVRDTSLASLRIQFVKKDGGEKVVYAQMKAVPTIARMDGKDPGSVVIEGMQTLFFPALPAGPYRIGVRSPDWAPVEQDIDVVAGEKNEVTYKLRPTAKLKVTFRSTEPLTVRFRLRSGGRILLAFPVGATGTQGSGLEPLVAKGSKGGLYTGLASGSVTIDVTDPTLVAEAKTVELREGETTEVEIEVRKR